MEPAPQIDVHRLGKHTVARIQDRRIIDGEQIVALAQQLTGLISTDRPERLVVNFSNVQFLSSAALGKLIAIDKIARQHGVRLVLTNIQPDIHQVFVATRLNELFDIRPDESDAMATT